MAGIRTYAPMIMLPFTIAIGTLGYVIESRVSDRNTSWNGSIVERREKRMLEEQLDKEKTSDSSKPGGGGGLENPDFVPKNVFQKNVSPTHSWT